MPSKRKFYKQIIEIQVLSEEYHDFDNLADLHHQITEGEWVGTWDVESVDAIDGRTAAELLTAFGSEPGFFQLTDEGEDEYEED